MKDNAICLVKPRQPIRGFRIIDYTAKNGSSWKAVEKWDGVHWVTIDLCGTLCGAKRSLIRYKKFCLKISSKGKPSQKDKEGEAA